MTASGIIAVHLIKKPKLCSCMYLIKNTELLFCNAINHLTKKPEPETGVSNQITEAFAGYLFRNMPCNALSNKKFGACTDFASNQKAEALANISNQQVYNEKAEAFQQK